MTTRCVCPAAGYCETHRRTMSEVRHRQCREEPGYFEAFQADLRRQGTLATPASLPSPRPPAPAARTTDDVPCVHRGDVLETVGCVPCRSRGKDATEIYGCGIHGRCMIENFSTRKPGDNALACVTCDERQPPASP